MFRTWTLRRTNNVLLTVIILVNLYVVVAPFAPAVIFWYKAHHGNTKATLNHLLAPTPKQSTTQKNAAVPAGNSLVVPAMLLSTPILEGPVWKEYTTLNQGVWRWPSGSTPDKGGNTILIGHRFTYTDPRGIFYELNKISVGDPIGVFWSGKEYLYTTVSVSTVSPSNTIILNQTTQAELTLYTCTPTWNPRYRLVVVANLTSIRSAPSS